ncbi:hypothetical protein [Winogradskyella sp. 3972H.M.0a.05]|uniref:hypothetical protein n=1 Tax=Winogradskyella sp. 3972H.M.0a.05 TaxID=2950277 RepID=UPI003393995E
MKPYIEFKKQRDLGEILSDTFGFLRHEFKPFFRTVFTIAGPALFVFVVTLALYNYVIGDSFDFGLSSMGYNQFNGFTIFIVLIIYLIAAIAAYILLISSALHYIKSYIQNKGETNIKEIRQDVMRTFWGFLGLSILKGITIFLAILICVLPVFYAMIPMAVVFSIYVFETRQSATDAYSKSFNLVNQDFWIAFGAFIILGILFYIINMVFSLPAVIYTYAKMGVFSGEIDPSSFDTLVDPVYIFLNVLSQIVQYLLNLILVIGGAVIYFHLNEKKNFTGTYERISEIGENNNTI